MPTQKKVCFVGRKGGTGKTTSVVHIAGALVGAGKRVLVVDDDINRSSKRWADRGKLTFPVATLLAMPDTSQYEYVLTDTKGTPGEHELIELCLNHHLCVVPSMPDDSNLGGMLETLNILRSRGIPMQNVVVLLTNDSRRDLALRARQLLSDEGISAFDNTIHHSPAIIQANVEGDLVWNTTRHRTAELVAADYLGVTQELMQRVSAITGG